MGWSFLALKLQCGFWLTEMLNEEGACSSQCPRVGIASVNMQCRPDSRESGRWGPGDPGVGLGRDQEVGLRLED